MSICCQALHTHVLDQTWTSVLQATAGATANVYAPTRRGAEHAATATIQLVGPTMELRAAKVCVWWWIGLFGPVRLSVDT